MTYHPPSHGSPPPSPANGHTFEIAMALGRMTAEASRHTEILLSIQERLIQLPDRLSDAIDRAADRNGATAVPPPPAPPPPPSPPSPPPASFGSIREWIAAGAALGALIAAVLGKSEVAQRLLELVK